MQLQDERRSILILGLGAAYIRDLTVMLLDSKKGCDVSLVITNMGSLTHWPLGNLNEILDM